jgi:hypothetical protein
MAKVKVVTLPSLGVKAFQPRVPPKEVLSKVKTDPPKLKPRVVEHKPPNPNLKLGGLSPPTEKRQMVHLLRRGLFVW